MFFYYKLQDDFLMIELSFEVKNLPKESQLVKRSSYLIFVKYEHCFVSMIYFRKILN